MGISHTSDTAGAHAQSLTFRARIWPREEAELLEVALVL
jgi:hypothetical protein